MALENHDRPLPRHSTNAGVRRGSRNASRTSSLRLSIIEEDAAYVPLPPTTPPPKTHNRPFHRRFLGSPPGYSGPSPPTYSLWDVTGPKGEKLGEVRNNAYVARRGGWRRICLIAAIGIACLVALAVGLAVGLHKKHNSSTAAPAAPTSSSSPSAGPFPIGSYTFTTFLDTTSTNCTSNPASWKCEPSVTYATSPTNAQATFNWIISAEPSNSESNLTISSTDNPFSIDFSNATLTLVDAGTPNERYTFTTTVLKSVFPSFNVKCDYNDTQFTADLYTNKPKSYPSNSTSASAATSLTAPAGAAATGGAGAVGTPAGGAFANWNFAVDATQSIGGGVDVPACYSLVNGQPGDRVTTGYDVMPAADFCSCAYKNYDP